MIEINICSLIFYRFLIMKRVIKQLKGSLLLNDVFQQLETRLV